MIIFWRRDMYTIMKVQMVMDPHPKGPGNTRKATHQGVQVP